MVHEFLIDTQSWLFSLAVSCVWAPPSLTLNIIEGHEWHSVTVCRLYMRKLWINEQVHVVMFVCLSFQTSAPAKCIFNISCVLLLLCVPMRLLQLEMAETILLAFAAPCAWAILLFFARYLSLYYYKPWQRLPMSCRSTIVQLSKSLRWMTARVIAWRQQGHRHRDPAISLPTNRLSGYFR